MFYPFTNTDVIPLITKGFYFLSLFRPSRGHLPGSDYSELVGAELHGRQNGSCHTLYSACQESVFDKLPFMTHEIYDS